VLIAPSFFEAGSMSDMILRIRAIASKPTFALAILLASFFPSHLTSLARAQTAPLNGMQLDALNKYNNALNHFRSVLNDRRAQIGANEPLPPRPGQALYLARNDMMSAYKDLTDARPSKIGRPNKFGIPPPISMPITSNISMNIWHSSKSCRHHPPTHRAQIHRFMTWSI
jgi:hypothetical protein